MPVYRVTLEKTVEYLLAAETFEQAKAAAEDDDVDEWAYAEWEVHVSVKPVGGTPDSLVDVDGNVAHPSDVTEDRKYVLGLPVEPDKLSLHMRERYNADLQRQQERA